MTPAASAPGKLVLLGEYAVLAGAPALAVAVPRRARASVRPRVPGPTIVRAPPVLPGPLSLELGAGGVRWRDASQAVDARSREWLGRLIAALSERGWWPNGAHEFRLDTRRFHAAEGHKLGLGSSAAATVVAALAAASAAGRGREIDLQELIRVHRALQGGGSGIDVAASFTGGLVRVGLAAEPSAALETASVPPARALHLLALATGRAVSTGAALDQLHAWSADHPAQWEALRDRMAAVARAGIEAVSHDAEAFGEAVHAYGDCLSELDRASGIGILDPAHERARRLAERCGVAYKPSGAGGDLGIASAGDPDRLAALRRRAEQAGLLAFAVPTDVAGAGVRADVEELG